MTKRTVKSFNLPPEYVRRLQPDPSGGYVATVHELPGCIAYGATSEEALSELDDASDAWIAATVASGQEVPAPANYDNASGKVALRISRRLHQQAMERAAIEGTSLNQLISVAVASYLGASGVKQQIEEAFKGMLQQTFQMQSKKAAIAASAIGVGKSHFIIFSGTGKSEGWHVEMADTSRSDYSMPWDAAHVPNTFSTARTPTIDLVEESL